MTDNKFALTAIDWRTVSILHAEHLLLESRYIEELTRWALHARPHCGILRLAAQDLVVTASPKDFEVRVLRLQAISPKGFWIEIDQMLQFTDLNSNYTELTIPVYIVILPERRSLPLAPAQGRALLETSGLQLSYTLTTHVPANALDSLMIARLQKQGSQFVLDTSYIPQCVYLNSHPHLVEQVETIVEVAGQAVEILRNYARSDFKVSHVLAANLAATFAALASIVDWRQSPYQYLQSVCHTLRAVNLQILPLGRLDLAPWRDAENATRETWELLTRAFPPSAYNAPLESLLTRVADAMKRVLPLLREFREPPVELPRQPLHDPRFGQVEPVKRLSE